MGVYAIRNKMNGRAYIGSSTNIERRWADHRDGLDRNWKSATNPTLVADWRAFGSGAFEFLLLEQPATEWELALAEIAWVAQCQAAGIPLYNRFATGRAFNRYRDQDRFIEGREQPQAPRPVHRLAT